MPFAPFCELLNRTAGDERDSSFLFFTDAGEEGILRRVFVDSPRIRFCGTLAVAIAMVL